jgi:hypothetical protein
MTYIVRSRRLYQTLKIKQVFTLNSDSSKVRFTVATFLHAR